MTANANPLPSNYGEFNFPRRAVVEAMHQAETAIRNAMFEVEALGADPLLTDAGTKLIAAKDLVSDWLEGKTGLDAAPVAAAAPGADDTARLDYIDRWRLRGMAAGYKWDSFHVLAEKPIREQLDELIAKGAEK